MGDRVVLAYLDNNIGGGWYDSHPTIKKHQKINDGSYGVSDPGDMVVIGEKGSQGQWLNYYGMPVDQFIKGAVEVGKTEEARQRLAFQAFVKFHFGNAVELNAFIVDLKKVEIPQGIRSEWIVGFGHAVVNEAEANKQELVCRYENAAGQHFALKDDRRIYIKVTFEANHKGAVESPVKLERVIRGKKGDYFPPTNPKYQRSATLTKALFKDGAPLFAGKGSLLEKHFSLEFWNFALQIDRYGTGLEINASQSPQKGIPL